MQVESKEDETKLQRTPYQAPFAEDDHNGSQILTQAEADEIFAKAVTELDTQPLKEPPLTLGEIAEAAFLLLIMVGWLVGTIYMCITYPHTLVILYTPAKPASITATLEIPMRTLAPLTLSRSATGATTGTGYQAATQATGFLTFYNGLSIVQSVPSGTVFTGSDGEKIITDQTANIPPNAPPEDGYVTVSTHALRPGTKGNIAAYDVSIALSSSLTVKNLSAFTGGRDARTFKVVAAQDLNRLSEIVNATLSQAFTTAFPLQPGETAIPANCHVTTRANHRTDDEAQSVTLTTVKTCSAVAYNQSQLTKASTVAFTKTRPGATYHLVGSIQTSLLKVTPLIVTLSGKWAYTFSQDYQDYLAEKIAGNTPAQAKKLLLHTGVISYASIPNNLPPVGMYINFLVLVS